MVLLALAVGGIYQLERAYDPARYDFPAGMDEYNYDRLAAATAAGRSFFPGAIYSLPGYPALLTLIYRAGGRSPDLVRVIQVLLGALGCGFTFLVGRRLFGSGGGLLAGLILALYGPAVFFQGRLLPAAAALSFSLAALAWWIYPPKTDSYLSWAAGGIILGLAVLFAPGNLFFALFLLLFYLPRRLDPAPGLFWRETLTVLGILAVLIPFGVRNSRRAGGVVPLTAHSGINFYIGNNPEANGGYRTPLFLTPSATGIVVDSRREAERRTGRELTPAGVSRFWLLEGLRYLAAEPGRGLWTWLKKLGLTFSPREYLDIGGEAGGGAIRILGIPLIPFWVLLPPALLGLFLLPRDNSARRPLFAYFSAQLLAILLFFHQGRTRLLLVPVLAVLSAGTGRFLWRKLRAGQLGRAVVTAVALALLALVIRGRGEAEMRSRTNLLIFQAQREIMEGKENAGQKMVEWALELHPELGGAELVLGAAAESAEDPAAAESYYRRAAGKEPFNPTPALRLSALFLEEGEAEKAETAARAALEIDPLSWRAHSLLADTARERGDREEVYRRLVRAVELNPNSARDQLNLALYYREESDNVLAGYHGQRAKRISGYSTGERRNGVTSSRSLP